MLVTVRVWANVSMGVSPWKKQGISILGSHVDNSRLLYATSTVELVYVCAWLRMCVGVKDCVHFREETVIKIVCVCPELKLTANKVKRIQ